jgi:hypothetical protein
MSSLHADCYETLKIRYRPLFLACQAALREWPGGASEIWRMLNRHVENTWGQFNPAHYGAGPSLLTFLDTLEYTQSRRIAHALGEISGHVTLPTRLTGAGRSQQQAADDLAASMRRVLYRIDDFSVQKSLIDRRQQQAELLELIDAAHLLYRKLNG